MDGWIHIERETVPTSTCFLLIHWLANKIYIGNYNIKLMKAFYNVNFLFNFPPPLLVLAWCVVFIYIYSIAFIYKCLLDHVVIVFLYLTILQQVNNIHSYAYLATKLRCPPSFPFIDDSCPYPWYISPLTVCVNLLMFYRLNLLLHIFTLLQITCLYYKIL